MSQACKDFEIEMSHSEWSTSCREVLITISPPAWFPCLHVKMRAAFTELDELGIPGRIRCIESLHCPSHSRSATAEEENEPYCSEEDKPSLHPLLVSLGRKSGQHPCHDNDTHVLMPH